MSDTEQEPTQPIAAPGVAAVPAAPDTYWTPPPPPPAIPPGGGRHPWRWMVAMVVTWAIIAGVGGTAIGWTLARSINASRTAQTHTQTPVASPSPIPSEAPITAAPPSSPNTASGTLNLAALAAIVDPAIVDVNTVLSGGSAAGTGMIITSSGEVLTNNHVVNGSTSITVTIAGHSGSFTAHVIGVAPNSDVALLQIEGVSGLPTVTLADTSSLQVGDRVAAFGNALGQGGTPSATQGSITALGQDITASTGGGRTEDLHGLIQSDAEISPGDSGGALVNSAGQVIGMITAGEAQGFRSSTTNVAYSIPTNDALAIVNKIRAGESSADIIIGPVGYLGVSIRDLNAQTAAQLGLTMTSGALVWSVQSGSPAAAAGIARYSVITSIGGASITSADTLGTALHGYKPGAKVKVGWIDQSGTSHTATVTLTSGPNI